MCNYDYDRGFWKCPTLVFGNAPHSVSLSDDSQTQIDRWLTHWVWEVRCQWFTPVFKSILAFKIPFAIDVNRIYNEEEIKDHNITCVADMSDRIISKNNCLTL